MAGKKKGGKADGGQLQHAAAIGADRRTRVYDSAKRDLHRGGVGGKTCATTWHARVD